MKVAGKLLAYVVFMFFVAFGYTLFFGFDSLDSFGKNHPLAYFAVIVLGFAAVIAFDYNNFAKNKFFLSSEDKGKKR